MAVAAAATALKTRTPGAFGTGGSPLADRTTGSSPRPRTREAEEEAHADSSAHGGGWTRYLDTTWKRQKKFKNSTFQISPQRRRASKVTKLVIVLR